RLKKNSASPTKVSGRIEPVVLPAECGQLQTLESHSPLQTFMQRCHPIECARRGTSRLDDSRPATGGVSKQRAPAVLRSLVLNENVGTGLPTPATLREAAACRPRSARRRSNSRLIDPGRWLRTA